MKRRRRNPQTRQPPQKNPVRGLFRGALIDILENDFRASRLHRSRHLGASKTWPLGSSNGQESLAASSLDEYVKAVLHDERLDRKDPLSTCGSPKQRRSQTPDPLDFEALCQNKDSTPSTLPSKRRNKELWTSGSSFNDQDPLAAWTRHGSDHNHDQPFNFQIRGNQCGWKSVKVVFDTSSLSHSLISEDIVYRLRISLDPMPSSDSPSIYSTPFGLVEPRWRAEVQIRTSPGASPMSITMASTTLLPGGLDMMIGRDLLKKLVGDMALTMNPDWTSSGLEKSTSLAKDAVVPTSDDDDDNTSQGRVNNHQHSTPQLDDKGSALSELCDSELELSTEFMDIGDESRTWCELLGGAYEAVEPTREESIFAI
ncbi:hypothetical protein CEP54_005692 [Fusarium duplospermum]|uniref:Uncharacterized protein n=1 Tax=Fusarium duplospermum TaxID=1325734 RepID=A0A428QB02_9HYPO|nr:hypothetical protein CEP54_005692 [Fusarium duplospermum]